MEHESRFCWVEVYFCMAKDFMVLIFRNFFFLLKKNKDLQDFDKGTTHFSFMFWLCITLGPLSESVSCTGDIKRLQTCVKTAVNDTDITRVRSFPVFKCDIRTKKIQSRSKKKCFKGDLSNYRLLIGFRSGL